MVEKINSNILSRMERAIPFLLFALCYVLYLPGGAPPAAASFLGDRRLAVSILGVPSSPADPLFLMAARLFDYLCPGAHGVLNISNIIIVPIALVLFFYLVRAVAGKIGLSGSPWPALAVTLFAAFDPRWSVLALSEGGWALSLVCIIGAFLALVRAPPSRAVLVFSFLAGLSLAAAPYGAAVIFLLPVVIYRSRSLRTVIFAISFLLAGLTPFIYLPLRAAADPGLVFAGTDSIRAFLGYIVPPEYLTLGNMKLSALRLAAFCFPAGYIGIIGLVFIKRRLTALAVLVFLCAVLLTLLPCFDTIDGLHMMKEGGGYFPLMLFYLGIGISMAGLYSGGKGTIRGRAFRVALPLMVAACFVRPGGLLADYSASTYGYDHARGILEYLPKGTTIFMESRYFSPPVFSMHQRGTGRGLDLFHVNPNVYGGAKEIQRMKDEGLPGDLMRKFHIKRLKGPGRVAYESGSHYLRSLGLVTRQWGLMELVYEKGEESPEVLVPRFIEDESRWVNWPARCFAAAYFLYRSSRLEGPGRKAYEALAIKAAGEAVFVRYWMGYSLMGRGETEEAIKHFVRITELEPSSVKAYTALARCYERLAEEDKISGTIDWANVYYFKGLTVNPRDRDLLIARGRYYLRRGKIKKSLVFFEYARNLSGESPELVKMIGYGYALLGEKKDVALSHLRHYLEAWPEGPDVDEVKKMMKTIESMK